MSRKIEVQIIGDSKSLDAALGRAQQKTSSFGKATAAGAKVGAVALGALGIAAAIGFKELEDGQLVAAQTAAVIKSTGGAAHVTAAQVNQYSQAMLAKTGIDDEAISSGQNMLLTFKGVRNELGKGNDIFNQARGAVLDLSVAMHTPMKNAAILVGKALQDPIKGMTALRRVGVSLTDAQAKLVKKLVDSGHTMKAQKIILKELHSEFGGSAVAAGKTLPGQLNILKETFKNTAASLVSALLPAFKQLIGYLSEAVNWMNQNQGTTKKLVIAIAALSAGFIVLNAAVKTYRLVTEAATIAQTIFNAVMDANPIALVIIAVVALGVALVIAYKKSKTFRDVVNAAFNAVKDVAGAVVGFIREHWKALVALLPGIGPVLFIIVNHWNAFKSAVVAAVGIVKHVVGTMAGAIRSAARIIGPILRGISGAFQSVINHVSTLIGWIQTLIGWISKIPSLPSLIPGGNTLGTGKTPSVAARRPSIALAGGGGASILRMGGAAVSGGRGSVTVQLVMDRRVLAQTMIDLDKDYRRQNGGTQILSGR